MQQFEPLLSTTLEDALRQLEGIPTAEAAVARARAGGPITPVDRGWLMLGEAVHHQYAGNKDLNTRLIESAVVVGERERDVPLQASALAMLGYSFTSFDPQRADDLADAALALSQQLPISNTAMRAKGYVALYHRGESAIAERWFERATALCLALNYQRNLSYCYGGWIQALVAMGRFGRAIALLEEMQRTCMPDAINGWAHAAMICDAMIPAGRVDEAYAALARLEAVATQPYVEVFYCEHAAELWLHDDQIERAVAAARRVAVLCRSYGNQVNINYAQLLMARAMLAQGDFAAAREWTDNFFEFGDAHGIAIERPEAMLVRARVLRGLGEREPALRELERALALADARGAAHVGARTALVRAAWLHEDGHIDARPAFAQAVQRIAVGGYAMLYEAERTITYPLLAAMSREHDPALRDAASRALVALGRVPPRPLLITGLGGFEVMQGSRKLAAEEFEARKAGELMRYLLLQPKYSAHRDSVLEALWSGQSEASAATALNKASSQLRKLLEPDLPDKFASRYVFVTGRSVALKLPPGSVLDFEHLDRLLDGSEFAPAAGELFPMDRHADWAAPARERLRDRVVRNRVAAATACHARAEHWRALELAREALALDTWNEDAAVIGMQAALALRNRPSALGIFDKLARALQQDLAIEPRAELQALADAARRG